MLYRREPLADNEPTDGRPRRLRPKDTPAGGAAADRRVSERAVCDYFAAKLVAVRGGTKPGITRRDLENAKRLLGAYSWDQLRLMIDWAVEQWDTWRGECKLVGVPNLGILWIMNRYVYERAVLQPQQRAAAAATRLDATALKQQRGLLS